jgi:hypothetical protein
MNLGLVTNHPRLRPVRRILNGYRLSGKDGRLAIDIHANNGFFAQLNWCLYVLAYCEHRRLDPIIRLTGPHYGDLPNHDWFHDFFEETRAIDSEVASSVPRPDLRIAHIQETDFASLYGPSMTIEEANRLFTSRYRVNAAIQSSPKISGPAA